MEDQRDHRGDSMEDNTLLTTSQPGPSDEKDEVRPRRLPQYIAALSATLGALAAGLVIGWSTPAAFQRDYPFEITAYDWSWVSSIVTLGAATTSIPVGMLTDLIGRRTTMLLATIPYTIGWACVIWPRSVGVLIFGRFVLGLATGTFCVAVPIYTGEIAEIDIRGRLGTYLELNFTIGILIAYTLGLLRNMFVLSLISAAVPLVFFATLYFMPDTPTYHLMKGNVDAAKETLSWLRGSHFDPQPEIDDTISALAEVERNKVSFFVTIRSHIALRGLFIAFGLMFFQQLSGMSAINFYGSAMFADASGRISSWPIIVIGSLQVTAVLLTTLVIDNWGRRIPLFASGAVMCVSSLILGVYLYLYDNHDTTLERMRLLPSICICCFVFALEFGFGPIPWLMMGEIFSPHIKGVGASSAGIFNALIAFAVTKFFVNIKNQIGIYGTFWIFSVISGLSVIFVFFAIPETKGKTLKQIQTELRG